MSSLKNERKAAGNHLYTKATYYAANRYMRFGRWVYEQFKICKVPMDFNIPDFKCGIGKN